MIRKKTLLQAIFFCVLMLPKFAWSKTVVIAYASPSWNPGLPLAVAEDRKFFNAEGFDVNAVLIRGGATGVAALVSGNVDYAIVSGIPTVAAIARGAPLMIVGGYSAQVEYVLIGAKSVKTLNDLNGKLVGVTGSGGVAEFATVEALTRKGMVRDKDYNIVFAGNSPARVGALEVGRIHAAPFSSGETIPLEKRGYPVLLDIGETLPDLPFLVIVTSKRKIQSAPSEVESVLRALHRAMLLIKEKHGDVITDGLRKRLGGDPIAERKNIGRYAKHYSIGINPTSISTLIRGAKIETEAAKLGGIDSFYTTAFAEKTMKQ